MEEKHERSTEQVGKEKEEQQIAGGEHIIPDVPVVRTNTPRPLPFNLVSTKTELPLPPSINVPDFPIEAPEAPPLPEEEAEQPARVEMVQQAPLTPPVVHEII